MRQTSRILWMALGFAVLAAVMPVAADEGGDDIVASPLSDLLESDDVTREELAGLYQALQVAQFEPPDCVAGEEMFDDVPASSPFCPWIEELARRGITSGCDANNYCPGNRVSRAEMAVFVVRGMRLGPTFVHTELRTWNAGTDTEHDVSCPNGGQMLSGGLVSAPPMTIVGIGPINETTWRVVARNDTSQNLTRLIRVLCVE